MAAKIQVDKYFEALKRLKARGEPINNDAVAKEAGSGKGSIKKSRAGYKLLIDAIAEAEQEQELKRKQQEQVKAASDPLPQLKQQISELQDRLDSALEREVSLLNEVYNLRQENMQLKKGRPTVVPK